MSDETKAKEGEVITKKPNKDGVNLSNDELTKLIYKGLDIWQKDTEKSSEFQKSVFNRVSIFVFLATIFSMCLIYIGDKALGAGMLATILGSVISYFAGRSR